MPAVETSRENVSVMHCYQWSFCAFHAMRFWAITDYVSENMFTYCFGDVADKTIAAILLIFGNDSYMYRACFCFSNAFVRSRERC